MSTMFNANLIIIGPIYDANREVTVDFFLHMLHQGRTLDSGAILITLMPVKIRGSKPVREYISYEPKRYSCDLNVKYIINFLYVCYSIHLSTILC